MKKLDKWIKHFPISTVFYVMGMVAIFFALFFDLPIVSGDLEAGKWAFIAMLFSLATFYRVNEFFDI
jgi:hypothetical protein